MSEATRRTIPTNGIRMAFTETGGGPPIVLCHGFPELAYSWRHQLPGLAAAGFRAAVTEYDIHHLTDDLAGLLDALDLERAVFVGHDWGGTVVWAMALLPPAPPISLLRTMYGDNYYGPGPRPGGGHGAGLRPLDTTGEACRAEPNHDRMVDASLQRRRPLTLRMQSRLAL